MQKTLVNAENAKKINVDRPTDRLTDMAGRRVASTRLKTKGVDLKEKKNPPRPTTFQLINFKNIRQFCAIIISFSSTFSINGK